MPPLCRHLDLASDEGVELVEVIEASALGSVHGRALAIHRPHRQRFWFAALVPGRVVPIHSAIWQNADPHGFDFHVRELN